MDEVDQASVAEQRMANIHFHDGNDLTTFVALRKTRDKTLATPVLLLPAMQVNIRAGEFPPAEGNGVCYLKIPLSHL